jgi:hypothetical protein
MNYLENLNWDQLAHILALTDDKRNTGVPDYMWGEIIKFLEGDIELIHPNIMSIKDLMVWLET